jgi:hypothetical protein
MTCRSGISRRLLLAVVLGLGVSSSSGCSRTFWRNQADRDSYQAIYGKAQRSPLGRAAH